MERRIIFVHTGGEHKMETVKELETPIGELLVKTLFQYTEEGLPFLAVVEEAWKEKEQVN